ncbi:hypothetical protein AOC06_01645 [Polynucleobacter paludilacus]|uniref:hypothetical protein n=1 Tax=Polynucleobacter paludilacus TaxID=1855895 RepID=UPI001BFE0E4E|nr:hypothetical protein [Polynucleobacter paludilacus]QWD87311.1 hypothetical protein AOC06_01645 [Polynucleobacter paludilacus]
MNNKKNPLLFDTALEVANTNLISPCNLWDQECDSRIKRLIKNKDVDRLLFDGYLYCFLRMMYGSLRNTKLFLYLMFLSILNQGISLKTNKIYINDKGDAGVQNIFLPHLISDKKTIIKTSFSRLIKLIKDQIAEYFYSIRAIFQCKSYPLKVKINAITDIANRHHLFYWKIAQNHINGKVIVMDYEGMPHENLLIKVCDKKSKIKVRRGVTPHNLNQGLKALGNVMDLGIDQNGILNLNGENKSNSVDLHDAFFRNQIKDKIEYYEIQNERNIVLILSSCNYINAISIDALIYKNLVKSILLKPHPNLPPKKILKIVSIIKNMGLEVSVLKDLLKEYRYVGLSSTMLLDLKMNDYKVNLLKIDSIEKDIYGNKYYAA